MIAVSFQYRGGQILCLYTDCYPSYHKGDIIWLQDSNHDLALTKFRVRRIEYSVTRYPQNDIEQMFVYLVLAPS